MNELETTEQRVSSAAPLQRLRVSTFAEGKIKCDLIAIFGLGTISRLRKS